MAASRLRQRISLPRAMELETLPRVTKPDTKLDRGSTASSAYTSLQDVVESGLIPEPNQAE